MTRRSQAVVAVMAVIVAACGGGDDGKGRGRDREPNDDRQVEATGDLLDEVEGVGAVYGGTVVDADDLRVTAVESEAGATPAPVPDGVLDLGRGLHVEVAGEVRGRLELRLVLPAEPEPGAIPAVLHVHDDGSVAVQPGVYDSVANEVVVWVDEFSDFFGGWYNPANWVEEVIQVGQGAWDAVADWMTGRTDPPPCGDAPAWASVATSELASVHVCLQSNPADDGTDRAELFVMSNRNTAQLLTLPAGADYVWVEDQPEWMRAALVGAFDVGNADPVDRDTHVVVLGGRSMSIGFRQPEIGTTIDVLAYRTWPMVIINPVLGLLGGIEGSPAEAMMLAVQSCVHDVAGIDVARLDVVPSGYDSPIDFVGAMTKCAFELAQHPDLAISTFDEVLNTAGLSATDRNRVLRRVRNGLDQIEDSARLLAKAFKIGQVGANAWDNVFDALADGRVTVSLTGRRAPALTAESLLTAPVPSVCDHPAGTLVDGRLPGIPEVDGGVWLYEIGWMPDDRETAERLGAFGDLTGDGHDEAVVAMGCFWGGVSWPDTVHVFTPGPVHRAELRLAEVVETDWEHREGVMSIDVNDDGTFTVEWITHVPGDAMCCGSVTMRGTFALDGDRVTTEAVEVVEDARLAAPDLAPGSYPEVATCRDGGTGTGGGQGAAAIVAMCVYSGFALHEPETVAHYAQPHVVNQLFQPSTQLNFQDWRFHGCNERPDAGGSFACTFTLGSSPTVFDLTVNHVDGRFQVVDAYIGEEFGD